MSPPSGNVSFSLLFYSPSGNLLTVENQYFVMQNNVPSIVKLAKSVFGVGRVEVVINSSPSWVSWVEIEGY
jgi:hypothetical protein